MSNSCIEVHCFTAKKPGQASRRGLSEWHSGVFGTHLLRGCQVRGQWGGPNRGGQRLNSFDYVEVVEVEELMVVHELLVKHSLHKVRVDTKALAQGARHGPRGPLRYHPQALRATPEVPEVMRFRPQASNFVSLFDSRVGGI